MIIVIIIIFVRYETAARKTINFTKGRGARARYAPWQPAFVVGPGKFLQKHKTVLASRLYFRELPRVSPLPVTAGAKRALMRLAYVTYSISDTDNIIIIISVKRS